MQEAAGVVEWGGVVSASHVKWPKKSVFRPSNVIEPQIFCALFQNWENLTRFFYPFVF